MTQSHQIDLLEMTTDIVAAYVSNNEASVTALADLIRSVHATLQGLSISIPLPDDTAEPAVAISKSITPDYLICLEDGRKLKMLKRYLRSRYDMTPEDYRAKWNLPADYPMVAPNYAKLRSKHAKDIGLGRKKNS